MDVFLSRLLEVRAALRQGRGVVGSGMAVEMARRWEEVEQLVTRGSADVGRFFRSAFDAAALVVRLSSTVLGQFEDWEKLEFPTEEGLDEILQVGGDLPDWFFSKLCLLILAAEVRRGGHHQGIPDWVAVRVLDAAENRTVSSEGANLADWIAGGLSTPLRRRFLKLVNPSTQTGGVEGPGVDADALVATLFSGDDSSEVLSASKSLAATMDVNAIWELFAGWPEGYGTELAFRRMICALASGHRLEDVARLLELVRTTNASEEFRNRVALNAASIWTSEDRFHSRDPEPAHPVEAASLIRGIPPSEARFEVEVMIIYWMRGWGGQDAEMIKEGANRIERDVAQFFGCPHSEVCSRISFQLARLLGFLWRKCATGFANARRWRDAVEALGRVGRKSMVSFAVTEFFDEFAEGIPVEAWRMISSLLVRLISDCVDVDNQAAQICRLMWLMGGKGVSEDEGWFLELIEESGEGMELGFREQMLRSFRRGSVRYFAESEEFELAFEGCELVPDEVELTGCFEEIELIAARKREWVVCARAREARAAIEERKAERARAESLRSMKLRGDIQPTPPEVEARANVSEQVIDTLKDEEREGYEGVLGECVARVIDRGCLERGDGLLTLLVADRLVELGDLETGRNLLIELLSGFDGRLVRARSVVMSGLTRKAEGVSWFAGKEMLDEILGGNWVPKPTEKPKKVSSEEVYNDFRKSLLRVFDAPPVISAERWVRAFAATLTESPDAAMLERFLLRARSVCEESAWVVAVGKLRHDLDEKGADPNLLQEFDRRLGEMGMQKVIEEWRALHRQSVRVKPEEWLKSLRDKSWDESFRCVAEAPKTKECLAGIGVLFEKALPDEDRLLRVIEFAETQAIWCAARHCSEINESFQTLTLNCLELLDAIEDCSQRGQLVGRICEWDYGFNDRNLERYIIGVAKAWAGCGLLDRAIELVEGMPERFDQRKGLAALAIRAGLVSGTSQGVELFKRFVAKLESGKPCVLAFDGAILIASAYANAGNSVMFCRTVEIILERYFSWTKSDRHQSVLSIPIQLAVMFTKLGLADQMIDFLDRMLADVRDCDLVMGGFWYSLSEDLAQVPQAFDRMTQAQRERIVRLLARETRRDPSDEAAIISGLMKGCQDMNSLMALWRESVSDPYSFAGAMTQEWMVLCSVDLLAWPFAVICPFNEEANRWYLQWRVGEAILKRDWEVLRSLHAACPELGLDWALAVVGQ